MNRPVIIIGGEGNGGVVAACIDDNRKRFGINDYKVYGFINDFLKVGEFINGYPVLSSTDNIAPLLENEEFMFMYAIHPVGRGKRREEIFKKMAIPDSRYATIVHATAFVPDTVIIHPGVLIMANSYIGPAAEIGSNTLIKSSCLIGHNTIVGQLCTFSAGSIVSSYVKIGKCSDVAFGARVMEKIVLGNYATVGAASLILKDVGDSEIHVGSPARFLRYGKED
jgi:sugar O-acyltransferase (sialic acid O-acetyltransferase NeuD family)